jgi:hypothetical protein
MDEVVWDEDTFAEEEDEHDDGNQQQGANPQQPPSDRYDARREMELTLVGMYDSSKINVRDSCYFLIDSQWVEIWKDFVMGARSELPPPVSNLRLYKGDSVTLRDDIEPIRDYRGVNPTTWFIYESLYGVDGSQPIARYVVDHRGSEVTGSKFVEFTRGARLKVRGAAQRSRRRRWLEVYGRWTRTGADWLAR